MKVNFGCGRKILPGFFNIDAVVHPLADGVPDLLFAFEFTEGNLIEHLPIESGSVDELHSYHVIEHFYFYDVDAVICEWSRILKSNGRLILELPNIEAACKNLLAGMVDQMCMWPLYGDPGLKDPYMCHRWGYTPKTIQALLQKHGYRKIEICLPQTHGKRKNRDMRVEAIKA